MRLSMKKRDNLFVFSDGLSECELSKETVIYIILKKLIKENPKKPKGSFRYSIGHSSRVARENPGGVSEVRGQFSFKNY